MALSNNVNYYPFFPCQVVEVFFSFSPTFCRCGCDECVISRLDDSLRHSRSRINAYRALASPSFIALSSKDPILTAFELSWELRRLSFLEHEFKVQYQCNFIAITQPIIIIVKMMPKHRKNEHNENRNPSRCKNRNMIFIGI